MEAAIRGHVIVATGVRREAACLAAVHGLVTIAGGGDAVALRRRIEEVAQGARGIVSFGMAGALIDGLSIGDWVVGDRLSGTLERRCDARWTAALADALPRSSVGGFYADGRLIGSVVEKRSLAEHHGSIAVDMESHVAGQIAADLSLPFAIVRCVSDTAGHEVPMAIAASMRPDGGVAVGSMLADLRNDPSQLPDFVRTLAGFARAFRALRSGVRTLGPAIARP